MVGRVHRIQKDLKDLAYHDAVITHLEPDILECEVKWALESITTNKASGGDGIPVELFQILKDDAVEVLHSTCQQIWKTQQWPQDWKRSVFIPVPKKGNAKKCSNYRHIQDCSSVFKQSHFAVPLWLHDAVCFPLSPSPGDGCVNEEPRRGSFTDSGWCWW